MKLFGKMSKFVTALLALAIVFSVGGVASASSSELTKKEKEAYYKQYVEIVKEVNANYPNADLGVVPLNEFAKEDWVEPEEFRELAIARANLTFTESVKPDLGTLAVSATKTKTVNANGAYVSISITGSFYTAYSSYYQRQVFDGINYISSSSSAGTWTQTGYTSNLIDLATTYEITVGGKLVLNGITSYHNVVVEFYCSAVGAVD